MSDNKFIERLKGKDTSKSILEINNEAAKTSFANMPSGTSNAIDVYSDHRADATAVLNGTTNWKISNSNLILANDVTGDGADFSSTYSVSGAGLWINSVYTFPSTGDPAHPVAMVFNPSTKWVLKVCGDNLIVDGGYIVDFTLLVKIGTSNVFTKTFSVAEQAGQFCKEFVLDFNETNTGIVKASGLSTLTVQLLCGTANASARIYNGMTVLTCLQRKVDASAVSNLTANVDDLLNEEMIPVEYFSNAAFIDQVADGEQAYAVFERDGDSIDLAGWTPKEEVARVEEIIIKSDTIPTASSDLVGSIYQYTGVTSAPYEHGYIYECKETSPGVYGWERIDVQPGGSRGRFLALWNCATGLSESNPPYSPYEYKTGDYFIVGTVSTATPAVNYKPDGTSYVIGTPSTTVETNEVAVDDTYFFDGTTWKLQSNSNKTVTFSNIAGDIYDNASATTALNAKQNTLVSGTNIKTINSTSLLGSGNISITGLPTQTGQSGKYLTTDGTNASWSDKPLVNKATGYNSLTVLGTATTAQYSINIGINTTTTGAGATAYGYNSKVTGLQCSAIGYNCSVTASTSGANGGRSLAIGSNAKISNANYAIQIGSGTNSESGSTYIGSYYNGATVNYKLLGANGQIPTARLADQTSATQGQALILDANLDGQWTTIATVATSGSYNDLLNKPTIPTVNDATITITQGGVTKGSFTLNQASGDTIALDAGGGGGGAVDSVNGKTGVVVLTATDVGALPDSTVIPDAQIQSDWNQADNTKVDFIKNKPTIPAAQVNSDWNANSGVAQILNKPTLATVASSGSYNDLTDKPTIPTVGNGTITITQGGVTKGSFTLNQSSGETIALDAGGGSPYTAGDGIYITSDVISVSDLDCGTM